MKIDLHIHSTASDGRFTPKELIDIALSKGLKAISITDHDNVNGLDEAIEYSKDKDIIFVPGIEFSANPGGLAKEIHIVGIFIDHNDDNIQKLIIKQQEYGTKTIKKIIKRLNDLGYDITYEEGLIESNKDSFGRPTLAQLILKKYKDRFKDRKQVFNELLGKEGKAFVENESSSIKEIINTIHKSSGLAILAHPGYLFDNSDRVIKEFIKLGGDGIEVDCPYDSFGDDAKSLRDKFRKIAEDNDMLMSGGTDFHEKKDNIDIGNNGVGDREFDKMKEIAVRLKNKKRKKKE